MKRSRLTAAAVALLLLLSGCGGGGHGAETTSEAATDEVQLHDSAALLCAGKSDYVLVYDFNDSGARRAAGVVADYLETTAGVRFPVKSDAGTYEKEILIGTPDREARQTAKARLGRTNTWGICIVGETVVLTGTENLALVQAVRCFAAHLAQAKGGDLTLSADLLSGNAPEQSAEDTAACVALYQDMYGTYSSYVDMIRATLSASDGQDQQEIEALIARMGESVAFLIGSSTALQRGMFVKLDPSDYSLCATVRDGSLLLPAAAVTGCLGMTDAVAENGYVDLSAYVKKNGGEVVFDTTGKIAVWTPAGGHSFADGQEKVGDYTNAEYLAKLLAIYEDPTRREPGNPTEQTRQVIAESLYDPTGVYDYTKNSYRTNYSPGICVTEENGREVIYVSYETCLVTNFATESGNVTYLKVSHDGGATFSDVGQVAGMRWACLFELNGCIYLLGTHVEGSDALIARYDPVTKKFFSKNLGFRGGIGAPCPVLIANGRIYKASGDRVMSAPVDADLLTGSVWRFSEQSARELLPESWFLAASGAGDCDGYALGEASMTLGPDGAVYMILRIDSNPAFGYAAIVRVSADGKDLEKVEECNSLLTFPSTVSKFSIVRDSATGLYLSMTSLPTRGDAKQRNVLALVASADLIHWETVDVLLVDREVMNSRLSAGSHAFQYVDFAVSGDNLRLIVRETTGYSNTYHDGKYITLYTVENYRSLLARAGLIEKGQTT